MTDNQKPVTIKSIARELGISFSSVAKALNGSAGVKEETRQRVLEKAREMGYTPNSLASGLRSRRTHTIAVIFNNIENPSLTYIFRRISIEMAEFGYTTMIFDSQFSEETERNNLLTAVSRKPDFLILEPAVPLSENLSLLNGSLNSLILLGPGNRDVSCHQVSVDYRLGGLQSARELLSRGHRELMVLTEPQIFPASAQYVEGIREACTEFGLTLPDERIFEVRSTILNGQTAALSLWDPEEKRFRRPVTGVLAFDDMLAYGVYRAAELLSLRIPEDLSVIGFDDNPLSGFSMPPLSTVCLPKEMIADNCIRILRAALVEEQSALQLCMLSPHLVLRGSVGIPPAGH